MTILHSFNLTYPPINQWPLHADQALINSDIGFFFVLCYQFVAYVLGLQYVLGLELSTGRLERHSVQRTKDKMTCQKFSFQAPLTPTQIEQRKTMEQMEQVIVHLFAHTHAYAHAHTHVHAHTHAYAYTHTCSKARQILKYKLIDTKSQQIYFLCIDRCQFHVKFHLLCPYDNDLDKFFRSSRTLHHIP